MSSFSPSITSSERNYLSSLPVSSWGVLSTDPATPMLVSCTFTKREDAQQLNEALSRRIQQTLASYRDTSNKVFKIRKSESSGYSVLVLRDLIKEAATKENVPRLEAALTLISSSPEEAIAPPDSNEFDLDRHPLDLLDQWRATDPAYVQSSMARQLARAKQMHGPIEGETMQWPDKNIHYCRIKHDEGDLGIYSYGFATTNGRRQSNEDAAYTSSVELQLDGEPAIIPLFGILDGHSEDKTSGRLHAASFTEMFAADFKVCFEKEYAQLLPEQRQDGVMIDLALFNALKISFVNTSIQSNTQSNTKATSGTTATVSLIFKGNLYTACSGDSRAMYLSEDQIIPLSWDAKVFNPETDPEQSEKYNRSVFNRGSEIINFLGSYRTYDGLNLTRALGHGREEGINARPKISKFALPENPAMDAFILCASDGLWDVATCKLAATAVLENNKAGQHCKDIAKTLITKAFKGGSNDNITALVLKIPGNGETIDVL